ncbi:hypothetical protein [Thermoanaerobacterium sp. DL9XJH110]|uniref:spermine/spermidine synthase domain-containing protein n=1 Tax=Thermoanaerobacterium sp. DL9XJH110 TaxID=3386643 RepID=UPI003BB4FFD6
MNEQIMTNTFNHRIIILHLLATFLLSGFLFSFEFLLTRIFSYLVWYHYVFVIISTAILGLGLGGIWVHHKLKKHGGNTGSISLGNLQSALLTSYVSLVLILYLNLFNFLPMLYMFLGIIPFAIGGAIISAIFTRLVHYSSIVYFADLLGTGTFSLVSFFVLNRFGMMPALLLLFAILNIIQLIFSFIQREIKFAFSSILLLVLTAVLSTANLSEAEQNFGYPLISQKFKAYGIEYNKNTKIEYSKWDAFSRTDVVETGDNDKKIIFIDGGSTSYMYRFNGDPAGVSDLKKTAGYMPFTLQKQPKTLVIGPGGGEDILLALLAGSKNITAVEINRSSIQAVRHFSSFSGDIYNLPQVKTYARDGRNFIEQTREKFDTIYLSLVMTLAAGSNGLSLTENYIYTREAISKYLQHLNDDGQLVFAVHDEEDMTRIITTVLSVFRKMGVPYRQAINHIGIVANSNGQQQFHDPRHIHFPVIVIRKQPFTVEQSARFLETVLKSKLEPVFIPEKYSNDKFPLAKFSDIEDIIKNSRSNAIPTTDDRPFFYNFSYGLPFPIFAVLLISIYAISKLVLPQYKSMNGQQKSLSRYFFLIGIGFMSVELALIQKNILFLGHPTTSFLVTVIMLLTGGSLGSVASKKAANAATILPILLAAATGLVAVLYQKVLTDHLALPLSLKLITSALILLPLGFLMGMPFPSGLERVKQLGYTTLIPLMWGINGIASLLGSALAVAIAMYYGFTFSLLFGATAYLLLIFSSDYKH